MVGRGKAAVATAVLFWSLGNLIVRGTDLTGPEVAFWRYLVAAAIYSAIHQSFVGRLNWADFKRALPTGIAIAVEIALFFIAIKTTTIANTTLIGALTPLLLLGVASRKFAETISARVIMATGLAVAGVTLVVFGAGSGAELHPKGDFLAVLALIFFAAYFVLGKVARESLSSFSLQTYSLIIGVPILGVLTFVDSNGIPAPQGTQWLYPLALIALPNTGHLLMNWAHAHVSLTLMSLMTLGVPVLSVLGAMVFFDETLAPLQISGGLVVLAALAFAIVETSRLEAARAIGQRLG